MIYEKFLMSAWIGDQSKLFGTSQASGTFMWGFRRLNLFTSFKISEISQQAPGQISPWPY